MQKTSTFYTFWCRDIKLFQNDIKIINICCKNFLLSASKIAHELIRHPISAGASIPTKTMMHFPLFQISPLFQKNFRTFRIFFTILPFPEKFLDFHSPKFLMTFFLSSTTNFEFSTFFPSVSRILFFPPYF